jgi:lactate dehydrogenase-like 2-hydroxyacid dehydrogenase
MTKRADILMIAPMPAGVIDALDDVFTLHRLWREADKDRFLRETGPRIRGLAASTLAGPLTGDVLDQLPALEVIANFGVGYDNIDAAEAARRGVVVTNTPGVLDDEVADLTIGLLLATIRQIPQAEQHVRQGRWPDGPFPLSPTLRGRRIGIVGMGQIGKAIAHRLEGFGVAIAYHSRRAADEVSYGYHPTLLSLAEASDVLIVIVPGGPATHHMVDKPVLEALGRDGILINVARGSVVDQDALIAALASGTILSAGLDVYADEPRVPQQLIDMPQVVLLPHIGSASVHTRDAMGALVVANLVSWFDQGRPLTPVSESAALVKGD